MTIQSPRLGVGLTAYHPWRGLAALLIFPDGQRRLGCGISKSKTPTLEPELNFADIDYQYVTSDNLMH